MVRIKPLGLVLRESIAAARGVRCSPSPFWRERPTGPSLAPACPLAASWRHLRTILNPDWRSWSGFFLVLRRSAARVLRRSATP